VTATATPVCGDNVIVPPETCDPPNSPQFNGQPCRTDCTYCGDGIVQSQDQESCDDGNTVSGCRTDLPQKPLDGCLNSCQEPICQDPSKIKIFSDKPDLIVFHGRLIAAAAMSFENENFIITLTRQVCSNDGSPCEADTDCTAGAPDAVCSPTGDGSVVFRAELPSGAIPHPLPGTWKYKDKLAKQQGGIFGMKIKAENPECVGGYSDGTLCSLDTPCFGGGVCLIAYKITMKAYGDVSGPVPDMEGQVSGGTRRWAVRGIWTRKSATTWQFNKFSTLLEPWP
jgi:hypothetical protein